MLALWTLLHNEHQLSQPIFCVIKGQATHAPPPHEKSSQNRKHEYFGYIAYVSTQWNQSIPQLLELPLIN